MGNGWGKGYADEGDEYPPIGGIAGGEVGREKPPFDPEENGGSGQGKDYMPYQQPTPADPGTYSSIESENPPPPPRGAPNRNIGENPFLRQRTDIPLPEYFRWAIQNGQLSPMAIWTLQKLFGDVMTNQGPYGASNIGGIPAAPSAQLQNQMQGQGIWDLLQGYIQSLNGNNGFNSANWIDQMKGMQPTANKQRMPQWGTTRQI
jgi:hypothetical protein